MHPEAPSRPPLGWTIAFSIFLPGLGHFLSGQRRAGLFWLLLCQLLMFGGFALAGNSQEDFGHPFSLFGVTLCHLLVPEMGNFLGSQVAVALFDSVDLGGSYPEALPWRHLGYLLSGMSGVLACFAAAHAAGGVLAARRGQPTGIHPGQAALAGLLLPGLGHTLQGRRFKGRMYLFTILGLFLLGMALGDFADFNRERHEYYWIGQMLLGLPGWICGYLSTTLRFERVLPYQDAGLLFTTAAGFFNVIASLDAWQRVEQDWKGGPAGEVAAEAAP